MRVNLFYFRNCDLVIDNFSTRIIFHHWNLYSIISCFKRDYKTFIKKCFNSISTIFFFHFRDLISIWNKLIWFLSQRKREQYCDNKQFVQKTKIFWQVDFDLFILRRNTQFYQR